MLIVLVVGLNSDIWKLNDPFGWMKFVLTERVKARPEGLSAEHEVTNPHWDTSAFPRLGSEKLPKW